VDNISLVRLRVVCKDGQTKLHEQKVHRSRSELGIILSRPVEGACIRTRIKAGELAVDAEKSSIL